jgi:hypothetical protein
VVILVTFAGLIISFGKRLLSDWRGDAPAGLSGDLTTFVIPPRIHWPLPSNLPDQRPPICQISLNGRLLG